MAEKEEEAEEEVAPVVVTPAPKAKRGRPSGSKNRAPDDTALLDRMTQLEETINRRSSESSTGGTIEPPPLTKPKRQARPRAPEIAPAPIQISQVDLLMEQTAQSREARRQRQLDFYNTFLLS